MYSLLLLLLLHITITTIPMAIGVIAQVPEPKNEEERKERWARDLRNNTDHRSSNDGDI